ncbi:hypothetical protein [Microbulbifer pacificus]|uniref:hypothetical protein n=1 Tax=Microbulbifer pacificus TaxID=407164 RepID=UPI000CF378CC|nr:hypothetical protein [Microbulbifer pacificus]
MGNVSVRPIMREPRRTRLWLAASLILLPLLPACSLTPASPSLEGFSADTLQQVRLQSAELEQLQKLDGVTPAQRQHMQQLQRSLQQFERDVLRSAEQQQKEGNWHGADQVLQGAAKLLPASLVITSATRQLAIQRQLQEERVRMELEIHRGEQLLKDAESYQRLQQLVGPGALTWLELKNYHRQRRATAQNLQQFAQKALLRENREDWVLARQALTIAQGLYGDDLRTETGLRENLERDLAFATRQLRPPAPRPARAKPQKNHPIPVENVQQALDAGDLLSARQQLDQLLQRAPQHPRLVALQTQYQQQLNIRVKTALKRGNDLYSQGEIERALNVWREASALAPDNMELLGNIARAEKVLDNLRALSAPAGYTP